MLSNDIRWVCSKYKLWSAPHHWPHPLRIVVMGLPLRYRLRIFLAFSKQGNKFSALWVSFISYRFIPAKASLLIVDRPFLLICISDKTQWGVWRAKSGRPLIWLMDKYTCSRLVKFENVKGSIIVMRLFSKSNKNRLYAYGSMWGTVVNWLLGKIRLCIFKPKKLSISTFLSKFLLISSSVILASAIKEFRETDVIKFPSRYNRVVSVGMDAGMLEKPRLLPLYVEVSTAARIYTRMASLNISQPFIFARWTFMSHPKKKLNQVNSTINWSQLICL